MAASPAPSLAATHGLVDRLAGLARDLPAAGPGRGGALPLVGGGALLLVGGLALLPAGGGALLLVAGGALLLVSSGALLLLTSSLITMK